jgi:hypothetical protein
VTPFFLVKWYQRFKETCFCVYLCLIIIIVIAL